MTRLTLRDRVWLRQSFILPEDSIEDVDLAQRAMTTASLKFTDTTLGGNFAINPPPQFTRFADLTASGNSSIAWAPSIGGFLKAESFKDMGVIEAAYSNSRGMGRYYSEAIDDNSQLVTMRFGHPQYNSMAQFFGNFYDPQTSMLARTGRASGAFFQIGRVAGMALALPWQPFILGGRIIRKIAGLPATKFYYLKPDMPSYWTAVSTIVNGIGVNMGITPRGLTKGQREVGINPDAVFTGEILQQYHRMLPDVIGTDGQIDVYAIATRAQRLANKYNINVREKLDGIQAQSMNQAAAEAKLRSAMRTLRGELLNNQTNYKEDREVALDTYVQAYLNIPDAQPSNVSSNAAQDVQTGDVTEFAGDRSQYNMVGDTNTVTNNVTDTSRTGRLANWGASFAEFFEGERRDGSNFVTFRVDYSGASNESFSTSTRPHDLASQVNSASNQARMTRINFAEGNLGDGFVAGAIETAVGAAKDTVKGLLAGIQMSGLAALAGNAFVDIPNVIDSMAAQLPRMDYTIQLRSPYGNKLSLLRNLYIPLACLMAGALPLSSGPKSYSQPFLVEAYCPGRAAIRLGVIDSLTITRGVGNLAWTPHGEALGIDVTFSIVDLSPIMHMPIVANLSLVDKALLAGGQLMGEIVGGAEGAAAGVNAASYITPASYDEDNSFTDYLAVLGALNWKDMVYGVRSWELSRLRVMRNWKDMTSPARLAQQFVLGTMPGLFINAISRDTDRP
jgi:hypothetical protein